MGASGEGLREGIKYNRPEMHYDYSELSHGPGRLRKIDSALRWKLSHESRLSEKIDSATSQIFVNAQAV